MNNKEKIILGLLNKLGEMPEEVAASLEKQGITGEIRAAWNCPIANYLKKHNILNIACWNIIASSEEDIYITSPTHIYEFVRRFDKNEFPNLVKK